MAKIYVQYGCGLSAPKDWVNFDASPTLRLQKLPIIGSLLKKRLKVDFPANVQYGDIIKGLPIEDNSCDGLYCSHVLEHLSLSDFRKALRNSYRCLKVGGIFRCIVPDLEITARKYVSDLDEGDKSASLKFMSGTMLGINERHRGVKGLLVSFFGNSHHLWMWDTKSLTDELSNVGFRQIRQCNFNDSEDEMFRLVEEDSRFYNAVAIECRK